MQRSPVTIVILAWNAWDATKACLDSLRTTLGVRDQVVVVDNGSSDGTSTRLRQYPWVHVITNDDNRGFAAGCNQGAAAAVNDVLVFLNNDTVLPRRWIDPLVRPMDDDPNVGATGPRSNFVSGPQVAVGASYADPRGMREFAKDWAERNRGRTSTVDRLVGFCLAVRRQAFEAIGGFDENYGNGGYEDDDLCRRLVGDGWSLLIAHDSFVHHEGHRTFDENGLDWFAEQESNKSRFEERHGAGARTEFPLVSACLITKDEEENLPVCLSSLQGFADEVVVYDTGSSDETVSIAAQLGAEVIEGHWDDDFARARNVALERCRGDWIVWLDADESLVCENPAALREELVRTSPAVDGYSVQIDNLTGAGTGSMFVHAACRLFRRASCEWTGRLHEQIAKRGDHGPINQDKLAAARILHTGYLEQTMRSRNKAERNLRVARTEVERNDGWDRGFSLTSLGRSYLTAGYLDEGLSCCQEALEVTDNSVTRRLALRTCVEALITKGDPEESLTWVARLRDESSSQAQADVLEARAQMALGRHEVALELFDRIGDLSRDDDGFEHGLHMYAAQRAEALEALGRPGDAADVLLETLGVHGVLDAHLGRIVDDLRRSGRPLTALADRIPEDKETAFLAQVLQLQSEPADVLLEACFERRPDSTAVLAAAASLARRLPVARALVWSARLRSEGYSDACPLIAMAAGPLPTVERARAAATAHRAFGDPRAHEALVHAFGEASLDDRGLILSEVSVLCPDLASQLKSMVAA